MLIAQWALESQWGAKPAGQLNYFGIKAHAAAAQTCMVDHARGDPRGSRSECQNLKFADYDSLEDSCRDYAWLITQGAPYRAAWQRYQNDHDLHALIAAVAGTYATDPNYTHLAATIAGSDQRGAGYRRRARGGRTIWQRLKHALSCALLAALTGWQYRPSSCSTPQPWPPVACLGRFCARSRQHASALLSRGGGGPACTISPGRSAQVAHPFDVDVMAAWSVDRLRNTADRRVGDSLARVDTALGEIEQIRGDLQPILVHTASVTKQVDDAAPLFLDCEYNPDCVFNRYVGASKGIERAALNFGQMSSDVRSALPGALSTWNEIGANVKATTLASTEASRNTAQVMANFARATKPLPTWARLGLAVAPPLGAGGRERCHHVRSHWKFEVKPCPAVSGQKANKL